MTDLHDLLTMIQHPDPAVRAPAIHALGESGSPLAVEALRRLIWDDSKVATHSATIRALCKLGGDRVLAPLIDALDHPHATVRDTAARVLGDLDAPGAVEPLIAVLRDGLGALRATAAESLGKLGDARAVEPLIAALDDPRDDVRYQAAAALGRFNDARAVTPLIAALDDPATVLDGAVCEAAAASLRQIDTPEARAAADRWQAMWSTLDDSGDMDAMIERLRAPAWETRHAAALLLGGTGDARAIAPLIAALSDPDADVRRAAAEALGTLADPGAVTPLIDLLDDPVITTRRAAIEALGRTGDDRAVAPLIAMLTAAEGDLDFAAAAALDQIGTREATRAVKRWRKSLDDNPRFPPPPARW